MRSLFYRRRRWQLGTCIAGVIAIALMLFIHGLLTLLATEPSSLIQSRLFSPEVFTLVTETSYWNAQQSMLAAPVSHTHLWWQPIAFVVAIFIWIVLWFLAGSGRMDRGIVVWSALTLSLLVLLGFSQLNQQFNLGISAETAPVLAFYLTLTSLLLSLGHWRK